MRSKFNQEDYDRCDRPCKEAVVNYLKNKGWNLVGDIDIETYQKYDVEMINDQGIVIKIENELRHDFKRIKNEYGTFHIPIRKRPAKFDFYFIWNHELNEIGIIKKDVVIKYKDRIKYINTKQSTNEPFLNIPIEEIIFRNINDF